MKSEFSAPGPPGMSVQLSQNNSGCPIKCMKVSKNELHCRLQTLAGLINF